MFSAEYFGTGGTVLTLRHRAFVAGAASVVGAIACVLAAHASGAQLIVQTRQTSATEVSLGAVVVATVLAVGSATGVAVLARRVPRPRAAFLAVTVIGLILTTVPPIRAAADTATAAWLLVIHAIVAASTILALVWSLPTRRGDAPTTSIDRRQ